MAVGNGWTHPQLYELLQEHGVLLLKPFLVNFPMVISMMNIVDPIAATLIAKLRVAVPRNWNTLVTQSVTNNTEGTCLITDRLFAGLLTPKAFTDILLPRVKNVQAIEAWQKDLDCEIEPFLWDIILRKTKQLFIPRLRDFLVQFVNRAFHYNKQLSAYKPNYSEMCAFCDHFPETYLHLFWECDFTAPLWVALQDLCYEHVDDEDFSQFKCLLSNFQHPLLNILTTIVKNYIHVCKWLSRCPTVTGLVKAINKARHIHFNKCKRNNTLARFHKLWEALSHDVAMNNVIKCWEIIEDDDD